MHTSSLWWSRVRALPLGLFTAGVLVACGGGGESAGSDVAVSQLQAPAVVQLPSSAPLGGTIYAAPAGCAETSVNQYGAKQDVYLGGGPVNASSPGLLPDTQYYVRVTTPSGDVLGTSGSARPVSTDATGRFTACYHLWELVHQSDDSPGYADTTNSGGEYKVWISTATAFDNAASKSDSFKVTSSVPPAPTTGTVVVTKFYDANVNGLWDTGEPEMQAPTNGWKVDLTGFDPLFTRATFAPVPLETVVAREYRPQEQNWYATNAYLESSPGINTQSFSLTIQNQIAVPLSVSLTDPTVNFGNVCTGPGGGHSLGFWSNKGQAQITEAFLAALRDMNLVTDDGVAFDPTAPIRVRTWMLNGRAVNMAYMLSVQMAAMKLSVMAGFVDPDAMVYAMGAANANFAGFIKVKDLLDEANASLGLNRLTRAGMEPRTYQELLKNALDAANNNRSFVQPTPCTALSFPAPALLTQALP